MLARLSDFGFLADFALTAQHTSTVSTRAPPLQPRTNNNTGTLYSSSSFYGDLLTVYVGIALSLGATLSKDGIYFILEGSVIWTQITDEIDCFCVVSAPNEHAKGPIKALVDPTKTRKSQYDIAPHVS